MRILGKGFSTFTHWFGWTLALVASVFFTFALVTEDIPQLLHGGDQVYWYFVPALLIAVTGCVVSFFLRKSGAVLMLLGGTGLAVFYYVTCGMSISDMMFVYGLPYILAGFLLWVVKE